jgi:RNA polymerase-associated protein LEO1
MSDRIEFEDEEDEITPATKTTDISTPTDEGNNEYDMKDLFGSDSEQEENEEETTVRETILEIPHTESIQSKNLCLFRLPSSLHMVTRMYSEDQILNKNATNEDEVSDFRATSTVRWRKNPETGNRESNARIVKWSDGSYTLHVGDETFNMVIRQLNHENIHLYHRVSNNVICGQGKFTENLVFQPTSNRMARFKALSQKKMQQTIGAKRTSKVTYIPAEQSYDTMTAQNIKKQGARQGMSAKEAKYARRNLANARLTNELLEEGSDEGEEMEEVDEEGNIGAMKKKYKKDTSKKKQSQKGKRRYSDEEEDEEDENYEDTRIDYDEEEEEDEEEEAFSEEEEEEDDASYRKKKKSSR